MSDSNTFPHPIVHAIIDFNIIEAVGLWDVRPGNENKNAAHRKSTSARLRAMNALLSNE